MEYSDKTQVESPVVLGCLVSMIVFVVCWQNVEVVDSIKIQRNKVFAFILSATSSDWNLINKVG